MDIYAKGKSKRGRGRAQVTILYPFFEQMIPSVEDPFWQHILLELAKGYAPKFFTIHPPQTIMFCKGAANENLIVVNDITTAVEQIITFFRKYGNIYSPADQQQIQINHNMQPPKILDWKNVGKHCRNHLLICYFTDVKKEYKLTDDILLQGNQLIQHLLCNGCISQEDIILQNNRITQIRNFYYNIIKQQFVYDGIITYKKNKSKNKNKVKTSTSWMDFIAKFERSQENYNNFYQHLESTYGIAVIRNTHVPDNNSTDNLSSEDEEEILSDEDSSEEEETNDLFEDTETEDI